MESKNSGERASGVCNHTRHLCVCLFVRRNSSLAARARCRFEVRSSLDRDDDPAPRRAPALRQRLSRVGADEVKEDAESCGQKLCQFVHGKLLHGTRTDVRFAPESRHW